MLLFGRDRRVYVLIMARRSAILMRWTSSWSQTTIWIAMVSGKWADRPASMNVTKELKLYLRKAWLRAATKSPSSRLLGKFLTISRNIWSVDFITFPKTLAPLLRLLFFKWSILYHIIIILSIRKEPRVALHEQWRVGLLSSDDWYLSQSFEVVAGQGDDLPENLDVEELGVLSVAEVGDSGIRLAHLVDLE